MNTIKYGDNSVKAIETAVMLTVSHDSWIIPKSILIEIDRDWGESIRALAERAFKKLETVYNLKNLKLLDYRYYGEVDLVITNYNK